MKLDIAKYDEDGAYYVDNLADRDASLNSVDGAPEIIKELRQATIEIILRQARKAGQCVVKVATGARPPAAKIRGYATLLSFVQGNYLAELEQKLGFKPGILQAHGAYIYQVDGLALNASMIAPRGNTDWPGGVTPRDLYNLSQATGVAVEYHRDYPVSKDPIPQFVILQEVPYIGPPRFLKPGESV